MIAEKSRKIAVFDIDGTLYRGNLTWDFFKDLIEAGLVPDSAMRDLETSYVAHDTREHDDTYQDFDLRLIEQFISNIKLIEDMASYWRVGREVGLRNATRLYKFTRDLFSRLKDEGYVIIAITNAVGAAAKPFAEQLGFDFVISNEEILYEENGRVRSWTLIERKSEKGTLLDTLVQVEGFSYNDSYGVGDTAGDVSMLVKVQFPIAFNPERRLKTVAAQKGWTLILERKNSIYCLRPKAGEFILDPSLEQELLGVPN